MFFLSWRELWFARSRFGLMGGVVALIAVLMVMLSGLSSGLVADGVSGLKALPVDAFAFEADTKTDSAFSRSTVDLDQVQTWRQQPGVADAAPFGNSLVNAHTQTGIPIDLALFGVETDSFLAPSVARGEPMGAPDGIVVSATALDEGLQLGDTVTIDRLGTTMRVVGVTEGKQTFGHVDVAYVPLRLWQGVHAGAKLGEEVRPDAFREASAVAISARPGTDLDLAAGDAAAGTSAMTRTASFDASPGYAAEMSTMMLIKVFLYAISALVVGAFFTVWTIQRRHEIAVLRALGAPTGFLLRDALMQALIVLLAATAVGVAVGVALGTAISGMPFSLETGPVAFGAGLLVVLGIVGAAIAVVRIARVDPLTALGGNR